ncbi:MAG TPA: HAD-IA family hydrolase [Candidatus Acidoferrum sp.]|nr:HAD-IA family hydrolase [Candidatus Acidoferrum sp.]
MADIRTVLFDLDGTLIDSIALILESFRHVESTHGLTPRSDEEWLCGVGTPLTSQFATWKDERGTMEAFLATYREFNLAHHDRMVRAFPGVVDAVHELRAAGLATGVVTSKQRSSALRGLRLVGLDGAMDVLVGADDVVNPKPHPEPVERAVRLLGADLATTIYVGDSIHDLQSGRRAGVLTGAALWGPFVRSQLEIGQPDFWLEQPGEIARLLSATRSAPDGV